MKRGIVITPDYDGCDSTYKVVIKGPPDPIELRKYILFWDKIDYPVNNIIHCSPEDDINFLIQEGIAKSTIVKLQGVGYISPSLFFNAQMAAYEANNRAKDEEWSIAQPTANLTIPAEYAMPQGCLEFELYNAFQIPAAEVPISDVLDFKLKREAELLALRDAMDTIVNNIINTQDIPKSKTKALNKLHRDLNNFNRVMSETKFQRVTRSIKTIATDPLFAVSAIPLVAGAFLPGNFQPYIQMVNLAGLGSSAIKFAYKEMTVGRAIQPEFKQFAYLSSMKKELL
ncbi:DUF6236 family protein [Yersinia kristensenii]|uniref:DUF6236 family protein n=1 Tax=Yersinia kristensenii TaxID=28152 RepID=UPI0011A8B7FE|nr:DUF6236 family protein [Yersinia kristensenii]